MFALVFVVALAAIGTALAATTTTTVRSYNSPRYGHVLVGPARYTLYVWCAGTGTVCTSTHKASNWPPLTAGGRVVAAAGSGIKSSKLGTRKLSNGQHQVTYYSQPLYLYKGDHKPCQFNGEGVSSANGTYFVILTSGRPQPTPCYLGSGPGECPPACGK